MADKPDMIAADLNLGHAAGRFAATASVEPLRKFVFDVRFSAGVEKVRPVGVRRGAGITYSFIVYGRDEPQARRTLNGYLFHVERHVVFDVVDWREE